MLTTVLSGLVIIIFGSWMLISILNQHKRLRRLVSRIVDRDICSLIPIWTFFAPNPGCTDVHILYRDRDSEGGIGAWREVEFGGRNAWHELWSPKRRISKGIIDIVPDLTRDTDYTPKAPVSKQKVLGFPYLLLLNYVCAQPVDFQARMRQFAVARTSGFGTESEPEVVFLSAFHHIQHSI
jgi:hypothetical protein